ncbi:hypothetical protein TpMuguga_04g00903 [Theileria parva strain Muguga]|uniref:Uncharacterized protein n=1 Tax=Theileria parva TaxID=5875 RepID=Q4N146_THEPA|nr:uncharacterized protein TpMuguga_04g00903 [Theileria parva strain Muguga]EAN32257.1 hypothetical protein TpMuguga_04g00903 [Theileria parva strain Muguga]|eukprot:XP_764540.1 hypothetical protein [Theileria parva strain Muguga]
MEDRSNNTGNENTDDFIESFGSLFRTTRIIGLEAMEKKDEKVEEIKKIMEEIMSGKGKWYRGVKIEGAIPIALNINQDQSGTHFTLEKRECQKTFEANEGYKFKEIVESFDPYVSVHRFEDNDCAKVVSIYEEDRIGLMTITLESNTLMYLKKVEVAGDSEDETESEQES